jgi:uncharacterized protein (UPF0548 family)
MKCQLSRPVYSDLIPFLQTKFSRPYNYKNIEGTKSPPIKGFDNDHNFVVLGKGETLWQTAKMTLQHWQQFPATWTKIEPLAPLQKGEVVAVLFRIFGIWFVNAARIVYTFDDDNRYGFAYGTLPGHIEKGEECFWIERNAAGEVSYHIRAFSKPAYWMVWLGYPVARYYQRRFVTQSLAQFKKHCDGKT